MIPASAAEVLPSGLSANVMFEGVTFEGFAPLLIAAIVVDF
jgi:hypothetical protein